MLQTTALSFSFAAGRGSQYADISVFLDRHEAVKTLHNHLSNFVNHLRDTYKRKVALDDVCAYSGVLPLAKSIVGKLYFLQVKVCDIIRNPLDVHALSSVF
jgi:hypothetical protein